MISWWFQKLNLTKGSYKFNLKLLASVHLLDWILTATAVYYFISWQRYSSFRKFTYLRGVCRNKFKKHKWLISCSYNPDKYDISQHVEALSKSIDLFSSNYQHFFLIVDLNIGLNDTVLNKFRDLYNLRSLLNKPTYYKNPANPSCIDLLLTNCSKYFQNSNVVETVLSDFNKMVVTVMKTSYRKLGIRNIML